MKSDLIFELTLYYDISSMNQVPGAEFPSLASQTNGRSEIHSFSAQMAETVDKTRKTAGLSFDGNSYGVNFRFSNL